ncbi:retrotransposon protein [Cucumis melo var. makuwa]|uniref:Retrotransposon protein n=1 Tax=Cucumis melo var. makuwa TaxID=1194695 RepID=A0A5D3C0I0_CUCMM|nr:retrotransposon protein [Cucumis melo var. makuwa]
MDPQTLLAILTAFTESQCQMLLTLEALMNDNKWLPHTRYDTKHRIRTYIKVNVPAIDCPTFKTCKGEIATNVLRSMTQKGILYTYWPIGKDPQQIHAFSKMHLHNQMDCNCERDIIICAMRVIQKQRDFSPLTEAKGSLENISWEVILSPLSAVSHHPIRIKTLKWTFKAIAEMCGPSYSGFRWNDEVKCIITEKKLFDNWVRLHPVTKGLLNKHFPYYNELSYVFERDMATSRFTKTFADVGSNKPIGHEGFDMSDGNGLEFPSTYSQGIDMSQDDVCAS